MTTLNSPSLTLLVTTGMVANKHHVSAAQATAMGMLSPTAGLGVMQDMLNNVQSTRATCGVVGGASARYWGLLLKAAKARPPLFDGLEQLEDDKVRRNLDIMP